jgi:predicted TIM-barrel fold metal-dependent hydrolase
MKIIDTHQHLWDLRRLPYSWTASKPVFNRNYLLEDYRQEAAGLEIVKTVLVEADVDEPFMLDEARDALALAGADQLIAGVVAAVRPERADFRASLEVIAQHPQLKGVRRLLHTEPDELGADPLFIENVGALGSYGLSFDICVLARQLPVAVNLVRRSPGVTFILDHGGNPPLRDGELSGWRDGIRELAGHPHVVCKISGLVNNADHERWTADDLRPAFEHLIECFGWDRILFGSDWPVCKLAASLREWIETLDRLTRASGAAAQQKLFHDNAARTYRLAGEERDESTSLL